MPNAGIATTGNVLNVQGQLFQRDDTSTPMLNRMPVKVTSSREFLVGAEYRVGGDISQPSISETASLTAPNPSYVTRENSYNVVQPFHESVYVSYIKQADTATLAGEELAFAGMSNSVNNELAWQLAQTNKRIRMKMENCVFNGVYAKGTTDDEAWKTRGLIEAIKTFVTDAGGAEMSPDMLADVLQAMVDDDVDPTGLTLIVDTNVLRQITKNWVKDSLTAPIASRSTAGFAVRELVTDFGIIPVTTHRLVPKGTALLVSMNELASVVMPTPGKGNFFYEELAKTGAGFKGQVFGMWGVDTGAEFHHAKITGLASTTGGATPPAGA